MGNTILRYKIYLRKIYLSILLILVGLSCIYRSASPMLDSGRSNAVLAEIILLHVSLEVS